VSISIRAVKPFVFTACLVPAALLVWNGLHANLGVNPIETITHTTGDWTLRLLVTTLAITPARRLLSWNALIRFRRMVGLFAFFYATLHLLTYLWLDQFFSWSSIVKDIAKRPFITVGFTAFVILVPLAATSTTGMIRRLGGRAWRRLHQLVYVAAIAGVCHYWWLVKADIRRPMRYAAVVAILLAYRAVPLVVARVRRRPPLRPSETEAPRRSRARNWTAWVARYERLDRDR
jgi:sulfoxide reductase heme-binding subunit YedZ